jgi:hypothetical protein
MAADTLMCWLNDVRVCGPDCVAYDNTPQDSQPQKLPAWSCCSPLWSAFQLRAGLGALVQLRRNTPPPTVPAPPPDQENR